VPYTEGVNSIYEFVKHARDEYFSKSIEVVPGYEFHQYETLRTIELYHNSRFKTSNTDELKREKPFYNICKFRVNVAVRATDLDTKDVVIEADDVGAYAQSFVLSLKNRKWMKETDFDALLNAMGETRAKYGHVVVKKVERPGELQIHVVPWRDLITDQVDITNGVKIERHFYSPSDLQNMVKFGWTNIPDAIATAERQQDATVTGKSRYNRTLGANIEVWEVHGVLPDSYLPENADVEDADKTYSRQMHIVVLDEQQKDETKGVSLFEGTETDDCYKDLAWEKVPGRGLGVGVIEDLFEAQVWTNYSVKQKKDMLDLAGKIIFQTADANIAAKNVLTDLENGSIITTSPNYPLTQVNNAPVGLGALASLMEDWDTQAQNATSTYPAILGSTPPHANAAFRLQASLQNEATAIFEYRRQELGIFVREIYRDWVLPFLVKQIQKTTEFVGEMTPDEVDTISDLIADYETKAKVKSTILSGKVITQPQADAFKVALKQAHVKAGPKRKFKFPKGFFKGDYNVQVNTTGEQQDNQKMLTGIFQIFGAIGQNPTILNDPRMANLFNQAMELLGVSPALMGKGSPTPNTNAMAMPSVPGAPMPAAPAAPQAPAIPSSTLAPGPGVAA
jgi:hypothetical protein